LPASGKLVEHVRAHASESAALDLVFACDAAYGTTQTSDDDFTVTLGTLPWRDGERVIEMEGFSYDAARDVVVQRTEAQGVGVERRFVIDTLEADFEWTEATAVTPEGRSWLEREEDTLLRGASISTK
jgi:hypothetical protein